MRKLSSRNVLFLIAIVVAIVLICLFLFIDFKDKPWFPHVLVTMVGLVGASWFVGHRLDLLDKGINQQQEAASGQLLASARENFNGAVKHAVDMMSSGNLSTSLAGQLWLHSLSTEEGAREAPILIQSLLCTHVTCEETPTLHASRQSAMNLLFRKPESAPFTDTDAILDLSSTSWCGFDFSELNLRGANLSKGNFTDASIKGTCFDYCDLRHTTWARVGGDARTRMCYVQLHGAFASTARFENVDFTGANLSHREESKTRFQSTTFIDCDFSNSDWTRATFSGCTFVRCNFKDVIWDGLTLENPNFKYCTELTADQFKHLQGPVSPNGLPPDLIAPLRSMGLLQSPDE